MDELDEMIWDEFYENYVPENEEGLTLEDLREWAMDYAIQ